MSQCNPFIDDYKQGTMFTVGENSLRGIISWLDGVVHYDICNPTLDQKLLAARILTPALVNIHKAGLRMKNAKRSSDTPDSDESTTPVAPPDYSDKIEMQLLDFIENNPEQISAFQDYDVSPAEIYAWSSKMKADFTRMGQPYLPPAYRPIFPGDPLPEPPKQFYGYSHTNLPSPPQDYFPIWANKVRSRFQRKKEKEYFEKKRKAAESVPVTETPETVLSPDTTEAYPIPVETPFLDQLFPNESLLNDDREENALLSELLLEDYAHSRPNDLPFDALLNPLREKAKREAQREESIREFIEASSFIVSRFFTQQGEDNQQVTPPAIFPGFTPDPVTVPAPVSKDPINNPNTTPEPKDAPETVASPVSASTTTPDPTAGHTPPTGSASNRKINTTSIPAGSSLLPTPHPQTLAADTPITPPLTPDSLSPP